MSDPTARQDRVLEAPQVHYSAALDEIYRQRQAAAYEAHVITGVLSFLSLPKNARIQLENLRERLWLTARGEDCYRDFLDSELRQRVMFIARMPKTLTRAQWEERR